MTSQRQYIELFGTQRETLDRHSAGVLNARRAEAFAAFQRLGLPTRKVERYRYTDVQAAFAADYGLNLNRLSIPVNPYETFRCNVPNLSTSLYFVVNDQFFDRMQPKAPLPEGVLVGSLSKMAQEQPALVEKYYGRLADTGKDGITALNTMLAQDGLFIYVPHNVVVERPIQVVNILRADVDLMVNRRVLIVLEQGAQAKVLVCDHAMDDRDFLATQVSEVFVGENAHLELYELEETHRRSKRFAQLYVDQAAYSTATIDSITLHNGLTRNQTEVALSGEHAETSLYGCVIADQEEQVENNTIIDHRVPNCQSTELYKYVLDGHAVGAFAGLIKVQENAQKTLSNERNANLCATNTARMYAQPMLEIYADDVKCSHGCTVGQLDEQALFYMRQRGIPEEEARLQMKFAFLGEVVDSVQLEPLRDRLHHLVESRFRGELMRCDGCKTCR